MKTETKEVTFRHLKKGQKLDGWVIGNCTTMASAIVSDINQAYVSVLVWGERPDKIPSEGTMFKVDMSEDEFNIKYLQAATEIMKALNNKLSDYEIGYHEKWNAWIHYSPFEMAMDCHKHKIKVIGTCQNVPQAGRDSDDRDVGICVEDEDGDKFWCHASERFVRRMIDEYKYLIN
jgi:hypothetical protein